jgi:hypothetical protein
MCLTCVIIFSILIRFLSFGKCFCNKFFVSSACARAKGDPLVLITNGRGGEEEVRALCFGACKSVHTGAEGIQYLPASECIQAEKPEDWDRRG